VSWILNCRDQQGSFDCCDNYNEKMSLTGQQSSGLNYMAASESLSKQKGKEWIYK